MRPHGFALALSSFFAATLAVTSVAAAESAPRTPAAVEALDVALWAAAKAGGEAADYTAYLDQFPEGRFAAPARERLAAFQPAGASPSTAAPAPQRSEPSAEAAEAAIGLDGASRRDLQERLAVLGHGGGGVDGVFGKGTRKAIKAWQGETGIPATGYLDVGQIARLVAQTDNRIGAWRQERREQDRLKQERLQQERLQRERRAQARAAAKPAPKAAARTETRSAALSRPTPKPAAPVAVAPSPVKPIFSASRSTVAKREAPRSLRFEDDGCH